MPEIPKFISVLTREINQRIIELREKEKLRIFLFGSYSPVSRENLEGLKKQFHEMGQEPFLMEDIRWEAPEPHSMEKTIACTKMADLNVLVLEPELPEYRKRRGEFIEGVLVLSRKENVGKTVIAVQKDKYTTMINIIIDLPVHKVINFNVISDIMDHLVKQETLKKFQLAKLLEAYLKS